MHWINTVLELLSFGWVGSIIGLIGIIYAVVTRQRTRLAYCCAGKRLLGLATDGLPEGITVHYRGQDIPRLTRTLVVLWNAGEKTILGEDIVATDPLRLKLRGDGRVLAATVLKTKRDVCQIEALPDASCPNETHIRFDFLDAEDGAVIEILHTSEKINVEFLGTVRGLPQGLHYVIIITGVRNIHKLTWIMSAVTGVFLVITGANLVPDGILISGGVILMLHGIAFIYMARRRYPNYLHIKELD